MSQQSEDQNPEIKNQEGRNKEGEEILKRILITDYSGARRWEMSDRGKGKGKCDNGGNV